MPTHFLKYPSLTNQYAIGKSRDFLTLYIDDTWYRTEKIDGTNIALVIEADGTHHFQSRNNTITDFEDKLFRGYKVLQDLDFSYEIKSIKDKYFPIKEDQAIFLYGELYGGNIQKRMAYDLQVEGKRNVRFFSLFIVDFDKEEYTIPPLDEFNCLIAEDHQMLGFREDTFGSLISADDDESQPYDKSNYGGVAEGEVWLPIEGQRRNTDQTMYGVKWKTEKFAEVAKMKHTKHTSPDRDLALVGALEAYVTENRLLNILSHGDIENKRANVGKLIQAMQADIKTEYLRENGITEEKEVEKVQTHLRPLNGRIAKVVLTNLPIE